jgi:hypothetical protein
MGRDAVRARSRRAVFLDRDGVLNHARTVLIDYGYREKGPTGSPSARVLSLREAAEWILNQTESQTGSRT